MEMDVDKCIKGGSQWIHVKATRKLKVMARGPQVEQNRTQKGRMGSVVLWRASFKAGWGTSWRGLSSAQTGACAPQSTSLVRQLFLLQQGDSAFTPAVCGVYSGWGLRAPLLAHLRLVCG